MQNIMFNLDEDELLPDDNSSGTIKNSILMTNGTTHLYQPSSNAS